MTGSTLLGRLRNSRWRRLAIALLGVPTILIGMLAMHVLTTGGMSESGASHSMVTHPVDAPAVHGPEEGMALAMSHGMSAPAESCGGLCGPSHEMLGMICVIALMVTIVLLALHLILTRWEALRQIVTALAANAAALAPPVPPSLHALSISRT